MYPAYQVTLWKDWFAEHLPILRQGESVSMPDWSPHPLLLGFERESIAEPVGQIEDWVRSFGDARLHIHVFADGRRAIHRDRWNWRKGPTHAALHFFLETMSGTVLLATLALALSATAI